MGHGQHAFNFIAGMPSWAHADATEHLRAKAVDLRLDALGGIAAGLHSAMRSSGVIEEGAEIGQ